MRMLFQIRVQGGAETRRSSCLEERGKVNLSSLVSSSSSSSTLWLKPSSLSSSSWSKKPEHYKCRQTRVMSVGKLLVRRDGKGEFQPVVYPGQHRDHLVGQLNSSGLLASRYQDVLANLWLWSGLVDRLTAQNRKYRICRVFEAFCICPLYIMILWRFTRLQRWFEFLARNERTDGRRSSKRSSRNKKVG